MDVLVSIVVGVSAGIFSGALASVLTPFVRHWLSRREHREQRTEQRHTELRGMIEARISFALLRASAPGLMGTLMCRTTTVEALGEYLESERDLPSGPRWRPHLIDDEALRQLCMELDNLNQYIWKELVMVSDKVPLDEWRWRTRLEADKQYNLGLITEEERDNMKRASPPREIDDAINRWSSDMKGQEQKMRDLVRRIEIRMDELQWW